MPLLLRACFSGRPSLIHTLLDVVHGAMGRPLRKPFVRRRGDGFSSTVTNVKGGCLSRIVNGDRTVVLS